MIWLYFLAGWTVAILEIGYILGNAANNQVPADMPPAWAFSFNFVITFFGWPAIVYGFVKYRHNYINWRKL